MNNETKNKLKKLGAEFRRKSVEIDCLADLASAYAITKYQVEITRAHALLIASHAMRMHDATCIPKVECMSVFCEDALKFFNYLKEIT